MKTNTWFQNKWDSFRGNFWFLPTTMSIAAIVVCLLLLQFDQRVGFILPETGAGSLNSMRSVLAVLIGALVTALSIVFSSTVVVLTLAASQLGPRLLRTYVRDRSNQVLIGIFSSTVFYNLTALFVLGRLQESGGIPNFTVLGGFLMTCAALFVLIYFIHHVARNIQVPNVILNVSQELLNLIRNTYPEIEGKEAATEEVTNERSELPETVTPIHAVSSGYIQAVSTAVLMDLAKENNLVIQTMHRPGHFIIRKEVLARVHSNEPVPEEVESMIANCFILGNTRTATQDVEFVMIEIVEIAVRALSPGINDPFTARTCVDRLAEALCLLADRQQPNTDHFDDEGNLRLILDQGTFESFCGAAFHQIRQHASSDVYVLLHMMESLVRIMEHVRNIEQKKVLWHHAEMIHNAGQRLAEEWDRKDLEELFSQIGFGTDVE
jgi:uncharacterized membrane protein